MHGNSRLMDGKFMKEAFGKPLETAQSCVLAERTGNAWERTRNGQNAWEIKDGREFERAQGVTDA